MTSSSINPSHLLCQSLCGGPRNKGRAIRTESVGPGTHRVRQRESTCPHGRWGKKAGRATQRSLGSRWCLKSPGAEVGEGCSKCREHKLSRPETLTLMALLVEPPPLLDLRGARSRVLPWGRSPVPKPKPDTSTTIKGAIHPALRVRGPVFISGHPPVGHSPPSYRTQATFL